MKLSTSTKVIITEEAGYKTEDVELLIGYLQTDISSKELNKVKKCKRHIYYNKTYKTTSKSKNYKR